MTISNLLAMFVGFGGFRIVEEGGKYLVRRAKDTIGAKKFDKMVNVAKEAVNITCNTMKGVGATAAIEKIREDVINKIASKTGLPGKEVEQYADEAMEVLKDIVSEVVAEDNNDLQAGNNANALAQATQVQGAS